MSAALVQQALEIVDPDSVKFSKGPGKKTKIQESQKFTQIITRKGRKEKVGILDAAKKVTIVEARKLIKTKDEILKANLKKLEQIHKASVIELDKETTEKIIERAVTRQPVKAKRKKKKQQKTVFTEEDFNKFEEEYTGD